MADQNVVHVGISDRPLRDLFQGRDGLSHGLHGYFVNLPLFPRQDKAAPRRR
ncbi:hypothetical protein [Desulfonatronum sp. SC1]|uniref:hypothetical protein n=1 Tax=Desulfonatronum sp. SC1 TaxID=2109626 RepID=UPI001304EE01|nr:hypothetical protein [Desulfonatronum sp. SC1]